MEVLETLQALVDYILFVDVFKDIGSDYSMQICIHEVKHEVYVSIIFGPDYVL